MSKMRVKIGGVRTFAEAVICMEAGADAIGCLVGVSDSTKGNIQPHEVRDIVLTLPPFISKVAVTHLADPASIIDLSNYTMVDTVQLHGDISARDIGLIKGALPYLKIIKAIHVNGTPEDCVAKALHFESWVDAILLDSRTEKMIGGTGITHDWAISAEIRKQLDIPIILAGGLHADNVGKAIKKVSPFGVDVDSGVEDSKGRKDPKKVCSFVSFAKGIRAKC